MRNRQSSKDRKSLLAQEHQHNDQEHHEKSDLKGDYSNIAILFFLYLLQGKNRQLLKYHIEF